MARQIGTPPVSMHVGLGMLNSEIYVVFIINPTITPEILTLRNPTREW